MNTSEDKRGVVIDKRRGEALLYLAITEKLVDDNPLIGDEYVKRILNSPPRIDVAKSALEQLLIGGKVYFPFHFPKEWKGLIFENQTFIPLPIIENNQLIKIPVIDMEVILGLTKFNNINLSEKEIVRRLENSRQILAKWDKIRGDIPDDYFDKKEIRNFLEKAGIEFTSEFQEIDQEQESTLKLMNKYFNECLPIAKAFFEYAQVLTQSLQQNAFSSLPTIKTTISNSFQMEEINDSIDQQYFIKLTSESLAAPISKITLSKVIEQTNSDGGIVYRKKLDEWAESCRNGNLDKLEEIKKEINRAVEEINEQKKLANFGTLTTWVDGGLLLLSQINSEISQGLSGLAMAVTAIGVLSQVRYKYLEHKNRWAMFKNN